MRWKGSLHGLLPHLTWKNQTRWENTSILWRMLVPSDGADVTDTRPYLWTAWWWPCSAGGRSRWVAARGAGTHGDWPGARRWSWGSRGRSAAPLLPAGGLHRRSPPAGRGTVAEVWCSAEVGGCTWAERDNVHVVIFFYFFNDTELDISKTDGDSLKMVSELTGISS